MSKYRAHKLRPPPKKLEIESQTVSYAELERSFRTEQGRTALLHAALSRLLEPGVTQVTPEIIAHALTVKRPDPKQVLLDMLWLLPRDVRCDVRNTIAMTVCDACGDRAETNHPCVVDDYIDESEQLP